MAPPLVVAILASRGAVHGPATDASCGAMGPPVAPSKACPSLVACDEADSKASQSHRRARLGVPHMAGPHASSVVRSDAVMWRGLLAARLGVARVMSADH
eukprot:6857433-Lingulodinium_polyedra.AAC.1